MTCYIDFISIPLLIRVYNSCIDFISSPQTSKIYSSELLYPFWPHRRTLTCTDFLSMDMTLVKMRGPATLSKFQTHRRVPWTPTSCLWTWHWFGSSNDSEKHLAIYLNNDQETSYSWRTYDKLMMTHKHQLSDQKLLNSKNPPDKYSRERLLRTLQGQLSTHRFSYFPRVGDPEDSHRTYTYCQGTGINTHDTYCDHY